MGDRLIAKDGSEAVVTARTIVECEELLYGNKFLLKIEGRIYQSCVRSAML